MRAVPHSLSVNAKEQLPEGHEDLLPRESRGLEDLPQIGRATEGTALDHRCLSSHKWLWWLHTFLHEVHISGAGQLENFRWLCMVAPQFQVQ